MAGPRLWTPDGMTTIEKDVERLSREEIVILSKMHEIAQKHQIVLVCKHCDGSFEGRNNDDPALASLSIACKCRELRYTRG